MNLQFQWIQLNWQAFILKSKNRDPTAYEHWYKNNQIKIGRDPTKTRPAEQTRNSMKNSLAWQEIRRKLRQPKQKQWFNIQKSDNPIANNQALVYV